MGRGGGVTWVPRVAPEAHGFLRCLYKSGPDDEEDDGD